MTASKTRRLSMLYRSSGANMCPAPSSSTRWVSTPTALSWFAGLCLALQDLGDLRSRSNTSQTNPGGP